MFAVLGRCIVRVSEDGSAAVVAGHPAAAGHIDGVGLEVRINSCKEILSDGDGFLYLEGGEGDQLRRLQLPAAWRAVTSSTASAQEQRQQEQGQVACARGQQAQEDASYKAVRMTSMSCGIMGGLSYGAYDQASRSLVLTSDTAVYRLPVEGLGAAAPGTVHQPVLVAGAEGEGGHRDGVGAEATFGSIRGIAVDGNGATWVLDFVAEGTRVARVDADGRVVTLFKALEDEGLCYGVYSDTYWRAAVLRNGCLALAAGDGREILLLQLGLKPPSAVSPAPRHPVLRAGLGDLLDRQPDGSGDAEVEVGGQVFAAHRIVLAARSPYFRQRLDPGAGFADGRAPRLSLPDADPAAFGAVLRFMYTDSVGPVPPELLQPVGELGDRLLLPGLCAQVGSQLLGRMCAESVVGLLLWAEQRSCSFGALLGGLKEWVVEHNRPEEGRGLPDEDVLQLMRESPSLALQLLQHRRAESWG